MLFNATDTITVVKLDPT